MQPYLKLDHIDKTFTRGNATTEVLKDINLAIEKGQYVSIIGHSGCGKSTLLNIMAGLIQPTAGAVLVDGQPISGPAEDRGMVFQRYTLFPWLHVRENIEFGPKLKGLGKQARREISDRLLDEMDLTEFAHSYPKELSGGMQQRVAIARALANDPKVLLMDEPFGALDALTRAVAQRFLTEIWEQHRRTIAFVTHDIDEAIYLGDTIFVMSPRPGRLQQIVKVDIARPRSLDDIGTPRFAELKREVVGLILGETG